MKYDFNQIIDRRNTNSLKYDFAPERGKPEGVLPLWVADMDFQAPPCVIEALVAKSRHGIFGYSDSKDDYFQALHHWFSSRFQWEIQPEWLVKTPSVVYAVNTAIRAFTEEEEAVLIQPPVYYPFSEGALVNNRKLIFNPLTFADGRYEIDFADFEAKIIKHKVKIFILCNPHNPVGRVWKKEELIALGDICVKHNVIIIADEIHGDFTYPGHSHLVFSGLDPAYASRTITCTAPSKTFNLSGLQISNIFIPNKGLRKKFKIEMNKSGYSQPGIMGMVACKAAYADGGPWLAELKEYLLENLNFARAYLKDNLPQIRLIEPEGTYLLWLDCRDLGLDEKTLNGLIEKEAGLWLDHGTMFGTEGEGFQRINMACPRVILQEALERLKEAIEKEALSPQCHRDI